MTALKKDVADRPSAKIKRESFEHTSAIAIILLMFVASVNILSARGPLSILPSLQEQRNANLRSFVLSNRNGVPMKDIIKEDEENSKQRFIDILSGVGEHVDGETMANLPSWGEVKDLYGSEPVIMGLETCKDYQNDPNISPANRSLAIAGLMNTGTHMLSHVLKESCRMPDRVFLEPFNSDLSASNDRSNKNEDTKEALRYLKEHKSDLESGIFFEVPWNKHAPESFRLNSHNYKARRKVVNNEHILPIIVVKDPYHWFHSMCRNHYIVRWPGWNKNVKHCPLLVPNAADYENDELAKVLPRDGKAAPIKIFRKEEKIEKYDSFVHYWNEWNGAYLKATNYPRLIIRYEDLLVHLEETITQICKCAGGEIIVDKIQHLKDTAKPGHQHQQGLAGSIMRYLRDEKRTHPGGEMYMTFDDLEYAKNRLDPDLMKSFHYTHPERTRQEMSL